MGGEVLAGDDGAEWLDPVRVATAHTVAEARSIAARCALAAGLPSEALRHGRQALEHDPYDEAALRVVMAAHVAVGRPASALAEYATMRSRLSEDLGVDPSPETAALHSQVLAGTALPAVAPDHVERRLVGRQRELRAARRGLRPLAWRGRGRRDRRRGGRRQDRPRRRLVGPGAGVREHACSRARCTDDVDLALQPIADALAALAPFEPRRRTSAGHDRLALAARSPGDVRSAAPRRLQSRHRGVAQPRRGRAVSSW